MTKIINNPFNYAKLSKDVNALRTKEGMSLREFGRVTEITLSSVYRIEAGETALDLHTVIQVCNWLNVPVQNYLTQTKRNASKNKGKNS